jgi:hypothetical protein
MRNLFLTLLLVSGLAQAAAFKSDKPVICGDVDTVLRDLQGDKYEEKPIWMGKDIKDGTDYVLLVNLKSGTWTFLQMNAKVACVLGTGTGHTLVVSNIGESI